MESFIKEILTELIFKTTRSGGSGGQHVNKVETKVEVYFDYQSSRFLSTEQKELITKKLNNRINGENLLFLKCDTERSQLANKKKVIARLFYLLNESFKPIKRRKKTKPTKSSVEKRLEKKKLLSYKKRERRNFGF